MPYKHKSYQKFIAAAASSVMAAGAISPLTPYAETQIGFSDVTSQDYFYQGVSSLAERGMIKGYGAGVFKPYEKVTRAQAAKMIALTLNLKTDTVEDPGFTDVSANHWAYGYIAALANEGIVTGYGDQFKPNDPITRAQLAKLITLSFKLAAGPLNEKRFTDVQPNDWYAGFVQPLIEKGITVGTTASTFSPNQTVSRGQIAAFLYRSELAVKEIPIQAVITSITSQEIITDKGSYTLPPNLKTWINPSNFPALKGALIQFNTKNHVVDKVTSVEITASGQEASANEAEFSRNLLLDGHGATIEGNVRVAGDFISLQHLTITGDLEIAKELEHDFYMDDVTVHGLVKVNGGDTNTVVFDNSTLNQVNVNKPDVRVESLGNTIVQSIVVSTNATIVGSDQSWISQVEVTDEANQVALQASVDSLVVSTEKAVSLTGSGNVNKLVVDSTAPVALDRKGEVQTISVTQPQASLTVGSNMQIQNLVVPAGVEPKQVVQNFAAAQTQISTINGSANSGTSNSSGSSGSSRNRPPAQVSPIPNKTITLGDEPVTIDVSNVFYDADNEPLTITAISRATGIAAVQLTGSELTITPVAAGTAVIQMSATDGKQSASSRFNVNVNTKPTGTEVPDQIITLGAGDKTLDLSTIFSDPDSDALTFTAATGDSSVTTTTVSGNDLTLAAVAAGMTDVTVTADDGRGGTISKTVHVLVNRAPEAAGLLSDQTVTIGASVSTLDLTGVFSDADGDPISLSAISEDTGVATVDISGTQLTLAPVAAGTAKIKVTATDGRGGTAEKRFNVLINRAPMAAQPIADQQITLGTGDRIIDLSNVFRDEDGDTFQLTAVSQDPSLATASLNGTELTIQPQAAGIAAIEVTADDGKGGTVVETFTVRINRVPIGDSIADQVVSLGSADKTLDLTNVFTDEDGDELTLSAVSGDASVADVTVSGKQLTITSLAQGSTTVTVTASDSHGGTVTKTFAVTVQPNQTPVVDRSIDDKSIKPNTDVTIELANIFRDPDHDALTYQVVSSSPAAATAAIAGSQLTVTGAADGTTSITVTATDVTGNHINTTFNVNVSSNAAPAVVDSIPEQVIGAGVPNNQFAIDQLFTDADGDALTYTVTAADSTLVNPSISGNTLTLAPGAGHGKTTVTVTANDGKGGTVSANIDVNTVQVVHNKKITTKNGVSDVSYDLASFFPAQNVMTVYRQVKGAMTQDGTEALNGKVFKTTPGAVGTTENWWIVANDGSVLFIELSVEEQQGAEVFFSEYTRGNDGRIAVEIYNKNDSTLNYRLIGYRYNTKTNQMEMMKNNEISPTAYTDMRQIYPGQFGLAINYTFYDLMDISLVPWYHGEFQMTTNGKDGYVICAFELIKDGQVVDVIGDKNWTPGSDAAILPLSGTMIRKKGIGKGSTTFSLSGEFDLYPTTFAYLGNHTP